MFDIFSKSKKSAAKKRKSGAQKKKRKAVAKSKVTDAPENIVAEEALLEEPSSLGTAQEKLDQAKANLEAGNFKAKSSPQDRAALIQQALAVHKKQSKLLDDLGEDTKQRLRTIAMEKVFKIPPKN